jgi:hypothetical protein
MQADLLEMNIPDYAEHRGVTRQAVGKLVADQKIPFRRDGRNVFIDVAAADRVLGETRERITTKEDAGEEAADSSSGRLTKAKTSTEIYRARLAELDYLERIGKLIPVEQLKDAAVASAEAMVLIFNSLQQRAPEIAAAAKKKGEPGVRNALKEIIREMRKNAAREFEKLPTAAMAKKGATETEQ